MTNAIPAPILASRVDDWQEVNGEVCRCFHEVNRPIPDVSGAYYSCSGRQLPDGSVAEREMYVQIPSDVYSETAVRSIIRALSVGLADLREGDQCNPKTRLCFTCKELGPIAYVDAADRRHCLDCVASGTYPLGSAIRVGAAVRPASRALLPCAWRRWQPPS